VRTTNNTHPNNSKHEGPSLRELFPTLSERDLIEAESRLVRYFEIALHMQQEHSPASDGFDSSTVSPTMKERSNFYFKI